MNTIVQDKPRKKPSEICNKLWRIWYAIQDFPYYLKNRYIRKHHLIDTKLGKGKWWDTDSRMLYGMMNLLIEFIDKEEPFELIEWNSDEGHKHAYEEMIAIRDWWLNYENRLAEHEKLLHKWSDIRCGEDGDLLDNLNKPDTVESKALFDRLTEEEDKLEKEEEDMLIRLIKIRNYLWT